MQTHQHTRHTLPPGPAEASRTIRYAECIEAPAQGHRRPLLLWLLFFVVAALALAAYFAIARSGMPHQADHSGERGTAIAMEDELRTQLRAERQQRAARAMCASDHGPHVEAVWIDPFTVACVNSRGRHVATQPMEALHASR